MLKNLYCIRNAHNISSTISKEGFKQIGYLKNNWKSKKEIELVISDPDIKSLKTSKAIFEDKPIVSHDFLHSPSYFIEENLKNDVPISIHLNYLYKYGYDDRLKLFYNFLKTRKECNIAYVGHNKFINTIHCTNNNKNSIYPKLKRVNPYLVEIAFYDLCDN